MHNEVIADKKELEHFFNTMLTPLEDDQVYVVFVVARKKYNTKHNGISRSEEMLVKKIITEYDFDKFYRTLKRFEVRPECFIDVNTKKPIPSTNIAYYTDLTPKSVGKALKEFIFDILEDVWASRTDPQRLKRLRKIQSILFSNIHKNDAIRKPYRIVDVDNKETLSDVLRALQKHKIPFKWITETRGGYHVIIPVGEWMEPFYKSVVPELKKFDNIEILDNCQTPIVGTHQGGFKVKCYLEDKDI